MPGMNKTTAEEARYYRFAWNNADNIPPIGRLEVEPKSGMTTVFSEGVYIEQTSYGFAAQKRKEDLAPMQCCIFCGRDKDASGATLKLTSEHVIPEFLGAGLELPNATCHSCQVVSAEFERSIAQEIFDPVRKSLSLVGKDGVLKKTNFPLDIGREESDRHMIPVVHFPTILALPNLYPASVYSRRPSDTNGFYNMLLYNINADPEYVKKYDIDGFSSQSIDVVRFCQMIAKIGHVYATSVRGLRSFQPLVNAFTRTNFPPHEPSSSHFNYVGHLWNYKEAATANLHEIGVGTIDWEGRQMVGARVRLFACYGFPSYHVAVGSL